MLLRPLSIGAEGTDCLAEAMEGGRGLGGV